MIPHAINNHDQKPFVPAVIAFTALLVTTVILWLLTSTLGSTDLQFLDDPLQWLRLLESQAAFDTLGNAAEVVAAVLAIAITVVAIIVELAANRYSHLITRLFIHEPLNLVVLGLFVVTTLQCVWTAATLRAIHSYRLLANIWQTRNCCWCWTTLNKYRTQHATLLRSCAPAAV